MLFVVKSNSDLILVQFLFISPTTEDLLYHNVRPLKALLQNFYKPFSMQQFKDL